MTIFSPDFESTNWDESNEPKIIQVGQIEAGIFVISIFGTKPIDLYRKKMFFHFSSDVATRSLKYVKFINLRLETLISGGIFTS